MGLFSGFFEDDRRSMTWKGMVLLFPLIILFLFLFGGTYYYAMMMECVWFMLLDVIAFTLNFIVLETVFMKNACEERLDDFQEESRIGKFPAVLYEADLFSCIIFIGYLIFFSYDYYKGHGLTGPAGIYAAGIFLPVTYMILILRNASEFKTKLISIFRILILDTIVYICCMMHICILIKWL